MKPGRLETDAHYRDVIQCRIREAKREKPEEFLPLRDITKKEQFAIYIGTMQRYIIVDNRATIIQTANGWGYKNLETLSKSIEYLANHPRRRWI